MVLDEQLAKAHCDLAANSLVVVDETVALTCNRDVSVHALRTLGADQGVFFSQLRDTCAQVDAGQPRRFKIEFAAMSVLSYDVKVGYYVVLLVDAGVNDGMAWRGLEKC